MTTPAEVKVILPSDTQLTDPQIQAAIDSNAGGDADGAGAGGAGSGSSGVIFLYW